jgi:hypothetical protein
MKLEAPWRVIFPVLERGDAGYRKMGSQFRPSNIRF